jgi:hypothetical protein
VTVTSRRLNPALIRRLNVARVFHALRLAGPASQSDLVRAPASTPPPSRRWRGELRDDGWIRSERSTSAAAHGRPPIVLSIEPSAGLLVGARLEPDVVRVLATTLDGRAAGLVARARRALGRGRPRCAHRGRRGALDGRRTPPGATSRRSASACRR